MGKTYLIFIELGMEWDPLPTLKGNNPCANGGDGCLLLLELKMFKKSLKIPKR
jgi:hypothetical protein